MEDKVLDGVLGVAVGDALGGPFQFKSRSDIAADPAEDMISWDCYPAGTWSDDTSLTLALMDSLKNGRLDYCEIMDNFLKWLSHGAFTPTGSAFDIGGSCYQSIRRYAAGKEPLKCGSTGEYENGNGSIMRILPAAFLVRSMFSDENISLDKPLLIVHNLSRLTHAHARSQIGCGLYISSACQILNHPEADLKTNLSAGIKRAADWYQDQLEYKNDLKFYERLFDLEALKKLPENKIKSSGYIVDTLEAAVWCLLTTQTFEAGLLKACNLGLDTDSIAAVEGGIAGIYYGRNSIPAGWLEKLAGREYIIDLCGKFSSALQKGIAL